MNLKLLVNVTYYYNEISIIIAVIIAVLGTNYALGRLNNVRINTKQN